MKKIGNGLLLLLMVTMTSLLNATEITIVNQTGKDVETAKDVIDVYLNYENNTQGLEWVYNFATAQGFRLQKDTGMFSGGKIQNIWWTDGQTLYVTPAGFDIPRIMSNAYFIIRPDGNFSYIFPGRGGKGQGVAHKFNKNHPYKSGPETTYWIVGQQGDDVREHFNSLFK